MSESAQELVESLAAGGVWPDPKVLEAILDRGQEAVEPLIGLLKSDQDINTVGFAADLLISIQAPDSLSALIDLCRTADDELLDVIGGRLDEFGPSVIEPLLEIVRDESLSLYNRLTASNTAVQAARDDLVLRAGVASALNEVLADRLANPIAASDMAEREEEHYGIDLVSSIVGDLANLADPRSRTLIASAFEKGEVDTSIINESNVDVLYKRGGDWEFDEIDPRRWLIDYHEEYQHHDDHESDLDFDPHYEELDDVETVSVETIRNVVPRPGRNDPCWCGNGKKYKKCHWSEDQARG